ncbi:hypothetical protein Cni_G13016 [Canna indica]|uniref:Uncharacterized protein n=1 Tax=Canna indica TaxID=4628 RepID=A0AAQ3KB07_9LILI|nr:hypothetical protein Cni_G13016 [Canna indica]
MYAPSPRHVVIDRVSKIRIQGRGDAGDPARPIEVGDSQIDNHSSRLLQGTSIDRSMGKNALQERGGCCPIESAHLTLSYLGDLGLLQFNDQFRKRSVLSVFVQIKGVQLMDVLSW